MKFKLNLKRVDLTGVRRIGFGGVLFCFLFFSCCSCFCFMR